MDELLAKPKKLEIFENPEFGSVRAIEIDGEPWFVGKDVADALGYSNSRDALARHVDDEDKNTVVNPDGNRGNPNMTIINESGLYSLVLSSKLPGAKQFKRWVTSEVIPSIRKHGGYIAGQETMTDTELMARALMVAQRTLEEREQRISALKAENDIMRPKAEYVDELVDEKLNLTLTAVAKELHMKRKVLITYLLENKFLYRSGRKGPLLPCEAKNDGYFEVREGIGDQNGYRYTYVQTLVTPKGRELLRLLCRNPMEVKAV